ncbi:methyltransferase [Citricoccus sp. NPDC055426]|uniref:RraA family protein n=1 Tax=Citricoccus sp. NPDC055426 TaxID=3155536 RepID=UPI00342E230E
MTIDNHPRVAPELLDRFRRLPAANVGDAMGRLNVASSAIRPAWPGARIAAPAFTVAVPAGDNLGIQEALKAALPGDVIVVGAAGYTDRALLGELIGERAINAGLAGFVVDGAVRDAEDLGQIGMPVFSRGITPAGPYHHGPYRMSVPVACGGVAVSPGDIVVADSDGVVFVPAAEAEQIAEAAEAVFVDEAGRRERILAQRTTEN